MPSARARLAQPRDAPSISALGRVALQRTYGGMAAQTAIDAVVAQLYDVEAVTASIAAAQQHPGSRFLVAEIGDHVVGFLDYDERGPEPELHRIYLRPDVIGCGVGTLLVDALHESLPADAAYVLLVLAGNTRAIAFYRRHGLVVRDTIDVAPYYLERMGVTLPADTAMTAHVMERRPRASSTI